MTEVKEVSRNEPCPCGSGKKYKRCHGVDAAPKLGLPKNEALKKMMPEGFDPKSLDQNWLKQFNQMMQRLPRGQVQKMQSLMQKAMQGKDVSQEMARLEGMLPPEFLQFVNQSPLAQAYQGQASEPSSDLSVAEAKRIVEEAASKGEISQEEASKLLTQPDEGKLKKFWNSIRKKD